MTGKRIVVKVGTSTLTYATGHLNIRRVERIVKTIADLQNAGNQMILVSSGSIALGMSKIGLRERPKDTPGKQACAAVGQCELMDMYDKQFSEYGVTVAIEPVVKQIVYDAKRARTVLDEIGSHNLQILLDPVNLLNMENVDAREEVFAEAIELLGKDVAMIHFKDFLRKDAGGQLAATGAGQGGMGDYRTILRFAKQEKPFVFATLENTTPENSVQCRQYLQQQYDEC